MVYFSLGAASGEEAAFADMWLRAQFEVILESALKSQPRTLKNEFSSLLYYKTAIYGVFKFCFLAILSL